MKSLRFRIVAGAFLASLCLPCASFAVGPVDASFSTNSLAANDDGYTGLVNIGFTTNFFGTNYTQLYVNNNGNVTFDSALGTYTPFNLYSAGRVIIAPFFADVDTRGAGSALTTYGTGTYAGHTAFAATWDGVGYYDEQTNKLNSFQTVLVDRSDTGSGNFDIYFNYNQIQWETGEASGGVNGLGGSSARVGYSNGTAANSYELTGSAINGAFLDGGPDALVSHTNDNVLGQYLFQVRNGVVTPNQPPGVPDGGATAILLGFALATLVALKRRMNCA